MTKRHSEVNFEYHILEFHTMVFWKAYLFLLKHLTRWKHTPQQNVCRRYRRMAWGLHPSFTGSTVKLWTMNSWRKVFSWHLSGFSSDVPGYILDCNLLWNLTFTFVMVPCGLSWSAYKLSKERDQVSPTLAPVQAMTCNPHNLWVSSLLLPNFMWITISESKSIRVFKVWVCLCSQWKTRIQLIWMVLEIQDTWLL